MDAYNEAAQSEPVTAWQRPQAKWIAISVGALAALVAIVWLVRASGRAAAAPNVPNETLPLVSASVPGVRSVTSTVTFIGALAARYDMPISAEGEGGRIVAVLAETGDQVKRGQVLARLDQSVLLPQVKRLAASVEEATRTSGTLGGGI